jgi:hypothetical protein
VNFSIQVKNIKAIRKGYIINKNLLEKGTDSINQSTSLKANLVKL